MADLDDDDLLDALGVEAAPAKTSSKTPREERLLAGFEDIVRFRQTQGRAPRHGAAHDIFERLYAVRLDQLRKLPEAQTLLAEHDTFGLLAHTPAVSADAAALDEDRLLAALGENTEGETAGETGGETAGASITLLRHVRPSAEKRAAETVAARTPCKDFSRFQARFEQVQRELAAGLRKALPFGRDASVMHGNYFVLGGLLAYVAEVGDTFKAPNGESDARLRVVYANGTESNLLRRSLQRALYKDDKGRRLTEPDMGPLFGDAAEAHDLASGTIYVLRSQSAHPFVVEHRELIHKIGVTGRRVETRIAGAAKDATYLLAEVDVVATYQLHNLNRVKLEALFHRLFAAVQMELTIADRFGNPVSPREWFLVPLQVINEAVERLRDGSILDVTYDPAQARLIQTTRP